mmetsp:Transcript_19673/g.26608  ORF Transcript_19673/g.26608 Transcript_19673/m.26608 type:complete len:135 (-) Transcript_19673:133-537(-)
MAFFGAAIIIFQYKIAVNYMTRYTYATQNTEGELGRIDVGFWQGIKLSFQRILMHCNCGFCCHSKRDRNVHEADRSVRNELKIVKWVQFFRALEIAFAKLFSKAEWAAIKKEAAFRRVYFDGDEPRVESELYDF